MTNTANQNGKPAIPQRLEKLMLRLASLPRGQAYTLTLFIPYGEDDGPFWSILPLGKTENVK